MYTATKRGVQRMDIKKNVQKKIKNVKKRNKRNKKINVLKRWIKTFISHT